MNSGNVDSGYARQTHGALYENAKVCRARRIRTQLNIPNQDWTGRVNAMRNARFILSQLSKPTALWKLRAEVCLVGHITKVWTRQRSSGRNMA